MNYLNDLWTKEYNRKYTEFHDALSLAKKNGYLNSYLEYEYRILNNKDFCTFMSYVKKKPESFIIKVGNVGMKCNCAGKSKEELHREFKEKYSTLFELFLDGEIVDFEFNILNKELFFGYALNIMNAKSKVSKSTNSEIENLVEENNKLKSEIDSYNKQLLKLSNIDYMDSIKSLEHEKKMHELSTYIKIKELEIQKNEIIINGSMYGIDSSVWTYKVSQLDLYREIYIKERQVGSLMYDQEINKVKFAKLFKLRKSTEALKLDEEKERIKERKDIVLSELTEMKNEYIRNDINYKYSMHFITKEERDLELDTLNTNTIGKLYLKAIS